MQLTAVRTLTTILDAPQLSSTTAGSTITLTWSPPQPKGQSIIAGFRLYKAANPTGPFTVLTTTLPGAASFPDTLGSAIQYYRIEAFDQYQTGNSSPVIGVAPALSAAVKWNPGFYMGSNNVNGTGASNGSEFTILAASGAKVLGWFGIYTWRQFETADGVYDFSPMAADFNALQAKKPGARFGAQIWAETFSGTTVAFGIPQYILTNSIYGPGQDGIHFGYWTGVNGGGFAAIWRPAANDRYARMFEAMAAASFVTTAGPYAGQTFTWDTHPLVEAFFDQETSLPVTAGSDYNESTYSAQCVARYARMGAAFKHTNFGALINDMSGSAGPVGLAVTGAFNGRCGMAWPDTNGASHAVTWGQHFYQGDQLSGTTFIPGGIDRRGQMACLGWVESPDYNSFTALDMFNAMVSLQVTHAVFTLVQGGVANSNWTGQVLPVINGNAIPNSAVPTNLTAVLPSQVTGLKLFAPPVPGALYGVCAMPSGNGSPVIGFEMTLSTGEVFTSAAYTTPVAATACVVYAHGLSAAISRTATMKAITAQGKSAVASPVSNAATSMAWTDQFQGSDSVYMFGGGSIDGLNPAFNDGYFDFATVRRVNPGDPTIASATVPAMNAPAYLAGFGLTSQGWMEVAATQSGGFAFLLNAWEDNPSGQNHNGVFNHTDYQFLNLLLYQPAGPLPFYGGNEIAIMFEGQISAVGAGTITFANQAFPVNAFSAGSTTIFNRSNLSVQPSGYSTNTATTFAVNTTGWAVGDYAYVGIGDVNFGNGVPDLNTCVTAPNPGVFTNGVVNVIKIPKSVLNITGLFNNLIYKFGIGSATQTTGPNAGKGVFYVNCLNWSKA